MRALGSLLLLLASGSFTGLALSQDPVNEQVLERIQRNPEQRLESIVFEVRVVETNRGVTEIRSLKLSPSAHIFRLALPTNGSAGGSSLARFMQDERGLAVFTGGFLETYSPAIAAGLVQQGTAIHNDIRLDSNEKVMKVVVCYSSHPGTPVAIMDAKGFSKGKTKGDCIQTGPSLIRDGKPDADLEALDTSLKFPFSRGLFHRAFLLINSNDDIVMGVTQDRFSLSLLRNLLLRPEREGGFGARTAVGLSGTRTAGFMVDARPHHKTAGNIRTLLPNAVVVERRR